MLALELHGLQLHVEAGRLEAARETAARLAPAVLALPLAAFPEQRLRAEALLWMSRAWRGRDATRALALARQAEAALPVPPGDDDNVTRRWLRAQTLGEQALAQVGLGEPDAAAALARQALALWQAAPPVEGPPPALRRWIGPLQALAGL